ncbi:MAG: hypothetical protein JWO51_4216 [Rhodospirillales bacterium]|nr:hypothetical protein [Rhodospirillales bacterium]
MTIRRDDALFEMTMPAVGEAPVSIDWRRDRALSPAQIDRTKAVTLDVFDTLIFRRCGDHKALHARVAAEAVRQGVFADAADASWYPDIRMSGEAAAKRSLRAGAGDMTIEAIYQALPASLGDLDRLLAIEWAMERSQVVANPFLHDLLQELAGRNTPVLLISDMYWGEARLQQLLNHAGIGRELYQEILVSCDREGSKSDGRLFDIALRLLQLPDAAEVVHIGDNAHADVAIPNSRGFRTVHYIAGLRHRQWQERETILQVASPGQRSAVRRVAAQMRPAVPIDDGFWFETGATLLGPVVDGLARWILADCEKKGIRRIAPIMREGAIFGRVLARYAAAADLDVDIEPIYLSRQALYLPTLERFDAAHLRSFAGSSVYRTLDHLLARYLVEDIPDRLRPFLGHTVVDLFGTPMGTEGSVFDAIAALLLAPESVRRIEAAAREQRRLLLEYLQNRWAGCDRVATVDFGANGTMNLALHDLPGVGDHWQLEHYLLYGTSTLAAKRAQGMSARVFTPIDEAGLRLATGINRSPLFLELLLNGVEATTLRYRRDAAGKAVPVTEVPITDPTQQDRMRAAHRGIDAYVDLAMALAPFDASDRPDPDAARHALGLLHRMVHLPTKEDAARLGSLLYDYNDEGMTRPIVDDIGRETVAGLRGIGQPYLVKMASLARRALVQWPEGILTQQDSETVLGLHLGANFDFGHGLICRLLIAQLTAVGEKSVILCAAGGDGGMGPTFIAMAAEAGIAIDGYMDYFPDRMQGDFHSIQIVAPSTIADQPTTAYAIVSAGYGAALEAGLRSHLSGRTDVRYYRSV